MENFAPIYGKFSDQPPRAGQLHVQWNSVTTPPATVQFNPFIVFCVLKMAERSEIIVNRFAQPDPKVFDPVHIRSQSWP